MIINLLMAVALPSQANAIRNPLRPPDGTYAYSMRVNGRVAFTSTIAIRGRGATFDISETTKLPNGAVATTITTWSSSALLPLTFQVHQGKAELDAQITPMAMQFRHPHVIVKRIRGTSYIVPSVGLISSDMMLGYTAIAHPGASFTMEEIQNNQTVRIEPRRTLPLLSHAPAGDLAIAVTKQEKHGDSKHQEQIVEWLNRKTGVMDGGSAFPGDAKITLIEYTPSEGQGSP